MLCRYVQDLSKLCPDTDLKMKDVAMHVPHLVSTRVETARI